MLKRYYIITLLPTARAPVLGPYTLTEAEEALKNISEFREGWIIVKIAL